MEAELQKKLLKKAGRLLARRAHSRYELREKLSKLASEKDLNVLLDRLEQLKLLNDADYAYNFAFYRIAQDKWGPIKVQHFLLRQYVTPQIVESAIDRVRQEMSDSDVLMEYLRQYFQKKRSPGNRKEIKKLILHLQRRGFYQNTIYSVLQEMIPAGAWQDFEPGE